MTATATLFTYRRMSVLTAAARALGLPEALLDAPHYVFTPVDGREPRERTGRSPGRHVGGRRAGVRAS